MRWLCGAVELPLDDPLDDRDIHLGIRRNAGDFGSNLCPVEKLAAIAPSSCSRRTTLRLVVRAGSFELHESASVGLPALPDLAPMAKPVL